MSEEQRVALVTGGGGGIGTSICKRLVADGLTVVTNYRNHEKTLKWQQQMRDAGLDIAIYAADISDYDQCASMVAAIEKDHGHIDVIVNNAGITRDSTLRKMEPSQWHGVIQTNLDSVYNVVKPALNGMIERRYGRIVNIASINGQKGQFGQTNYSAAKAGMHGFTKALAQEVARNGITVNTVSPGYIGTEMVMAVPEKVRERIIAQIPVGRLGLPEEVAAAVAYLVSDAAAFATGSDLSINGGQHMY